MGIAPQSQNKNRLTDEYAGILSSLNNAGEKGAPMKSQGENKLLFLVGAAEQKTHFAVILVYFLLT